MDLDDAAAAALWALRGADKERLGLLYEQDGGIKRTPTQSQDRSNAARGAFEIPTGSLRALFHNHPLPENPRARQNASRFSRDDIAQATRLRVPSYISVGDDVRRYDPGAMSDRGEAVLAQFPIEEWRAHLMRTLLDRAPDDPRGLYK